MCNYSLSEGCRFNRYLHFTIDGFLIKTSTQQKLRTRQIREKSEQKRETEGPWIDARVTAGERQALETGHEVHVDVLDVDVMQAERNG